jgi:hypothetical protein
MFGLAMMAPVAESQTLPKIARVGVLTGAPSHPHPLTEGLEALGWVEGRNVIIEWRFTQGNLERADQLAAELIRLVRISIPALLLSGSLYWLSTRPGAFSDHAK